MGATPATGVVPAAGVAREIAVGASGGGVQAAPAGGVVQAAAAGTGGLQAVAGLEDSTYRTNFCWMSGVCVILLLMVGWFLL